MLWSAHITNDGSGELMLDWSCLSHGFPRPSFGAELLEEASNVTFVKR